MRWLLKLSMLLAMGPSLTVAWSQTHLIPPPTDPQHYLAGTLEANDQFVVTQTSSPDNKYDPATYRAHLVNTTLQNPRKDVWIYLRLNVVGSTFDPNDPGHPWSTVSAGAGYTTTPGARQFLYSGSSLQFLELWQTVVIEPNPPEEDFDFGRLLSGANAPRLMAMDIRTKCVPEPTTLVVGLVAAGVAALQRRRPHR